MQLSCWPQDCVEDVHTYGRCTSYCGTEAQAYCCKFPSDADEVRFYIDTLEEGGANYMNPDMCPLHVWQEYLQALEQNYDNDPDNFKCILGYDGNILLFGKKGKNQDF